MAKMTRNIYIPFLDLDKGANKATNKYRLGRVRTSTIFNFQQNAQEEAYQFIDSETDTTEIQSYQPDVSLETVPESKDPVARFVQKQLFAFELGEDTHVPYIQAIPYIHDDGTIDDTYCEVIIWDNAVMSNLALDTVAQKFTWDEKLNGERKHGIVTIESLLQEEFTFEPVTEPITPPTTEVQTFSAKSAKATDKE